jgi:RecB family endonuclease NucS
MRLVIARCTVDYSGRLEAHLPEAVRLIMVKADGTLAIHSDGNASKPLNWMVAPNTLTTGDEEWVVTNKKGERLQITISEILEDVTHDLGDDPGLVKDGVEEHLQTLLAGKPWVLEDGLTLIRREYPTDIGPVDLLCSSPGGGTVAVEIKRRGDIDGVEQLARSGAVEHGQPHFAGAGDLRRTADRPSGSRLGRVTGDRCDRGGLRRPS